MSFQKTVGIMKTFEECTKMQIKEEDLHDKLLFTKGDGNKKIKEYKCECCSHENLNQETKGVITIETKSHEEIIKGEFYKPYLPF
ncbi:hypothetical protein R6Q57_009733 [Mikania cordata]